MQPGRSESLWKWSNDTMSRNVLKFSPVCSVWFVWMQSLCMYNTQHILEPKQGEVVDFQVRRISFLATIVPKFRAICMSYSSSEVCAERPKTAGHGWAECLWNRLLRATQKLLSKSYVMLSKTRRDVLVILQRNSTYAFGRHWWEDASQFCLGVM